MKKLLIVLGLLLFASSAHAQSTSSTWIDITAAPYSAKNDCSVDAGAKINSAIANDTRGNLVLFFPVGCYLISTQIVDTRTTGGTVGTYTKITYWGYGAEFRAAQGPNPPAPTNSI